MIAGSGPVAQRLEQRTHNSWVGGSNPPGPFLNPRSQATTRMATWVRCVRGVGFGSCRADPGGTRPARKGSATRDDEHAPSARTALAAHVDLLESLDDERAVQRPVNELADPRVRHNGTNDSQPIALQANRVAHLRLVAELDFAGVVAVGKSERGTNPIFSLPGPAASRAYARSVGRSISLRAGGDAASLGRVDAV